MTVEDINKVELDYRESKIQHTCVNWFRDTFPKVEHLLFAIPNGGWRGARAGAMMVYEGQVKGASDLILLYPSGGKSALCIEMKRPDKKGRPKSRQSQEQKEWQALVEEYGSCYVICHGLVEFITAVCNYLNTDSEKYLSEALNKYPLYL